MYSDRTSMFLEKQLQHLTATFHAMREQYAYYGLNIADPATTALDQVRSEH